VVTEKEVNEACVAKGLNYPRVTPDDVDAAIVDEVYFTAAQGTLGAVIANEKILEASVAADDLSPTKLAPLDLLTFCVLVLRNGFTVTGESACASPENFNAELGRKIAKDNARAKIWPLLGYALKDRLSKE
jgi:hypothetical protein